MNKHIIYVVALICASLFAMGCSQEPLTTSDEGGVGTLKMNISATRGGESQYEPMDHLTVRIFNSQGGLLRKYSSKETIPASLELLAGEYRVAVEAGERLAEDTKGGASFEVRYYEGEQNFTVVAGQSISVEVICKCKNTAVEVQFDASVAKNFTSYHAWIAADENFSDTRVEAGDVAALKYTDNAKGYFDLLESETTLAWKFSGEHTTRGTIEKTGVMTAIKQGGRYILQLNFSPDLPGFIVGFPVSVDTSTDDKDDMFVFNPDPVIEGVGFDMRQKQEYITGEKQFSISTVKPMQEATLLVGEQKIDLIAAVAGNTPAGMTIAQPNSNTLLVTLADAFFTQRTGGDHLLKFSVSDIAGGAVAAPTTFRLQGIIPPVAYDWNLWTNSVTLRIVQFAPISTTTFGLRATNGTWQEAEGVLGGDGTYSATFTTDWAESTNPAGKTVYSPKAGTGVFAMSSYECRAVIDGATSLASFSTTGNQIIPDGDMEKGSLPCFAKSSSSSPFWGSGNAAKDGLCVQSTKKGMEGENCALLRPGVTLGNLAAGNLFTAAFTFGGTSGSVYFGVPYQWTARPKALHIKYHAKIGAITNGNASGYEHINDGQDCARVFVAIVDWDSRHTVTAGLGSPSGVWDPASQTSTGSGAIIAYGSMLIKQSTTGDEMVDGTLELFYYDKETLPSKSYSLVISSATSYYGDYKVGCNSNELYIDDFKWVY